MMRVSKTLLCALAARASLAVRHNLKVDKSGAANVVQQIGALIQAQDKSAVQSKAMENLLMLAAITPQAEGALNDALEKVIADIEKNVDSKIKAAFTATQTQVDTKISDLDVATTFALTEKSAADTADGSWFACIGVEKSKREDIETAVTTEMDANAATITPCQQQVDRTVFESDPNEAGSEQWAFACDFSSGDACDKSLEAYNKAVTDMLDKLDGDAQQAAGSWNEAKTACDAAVAHATEMEQARVESISAWTAQKNDCQSQHEQRQLGMCNFGRSLQHKCSKVGAYNDLIAEVDQVDGGEHSEADRAKEWETTQVTKCMLRHVMAGADIDAASLEECASPSAVDYAAAVGQLDKKEAQFSTLTSVTSFTCSEESITFKGETWSVPEEESPPSADYTTTSYHPEVVLAENSPPFTFCP